jgi:hypothetical protein
MDSYDVKLKLMDLISDASSQLSPRQKHVLGNWRLEAWELNKEFPVVTVQLKMRQVPVYGFKTPTLSHAEYYWYDATLYVYHDSMTTSRDLMDAILDYLYQNNKQTVNATVKIIDMTDFVTREDIPMRGTRRYWRMVLRFVLICEESLG